MSGVDAAFILAVEDRPKLDSIIKVDEGIPVIDLSAWNSSDDSASNRSAVVAEIGDACKNWGFFQVINHGVPSACRERMDLASRKFFAQSEEEKRKVSRDELNPMGYHDAEFTKNVRDWKEVFDFSVQTPTLIPASSEPDDQEMKMMINQWPHYPPNFREACEGYAREIEKLCYKLLELISLSLGLPTDRMNGFFESQTSLIRLNHYPSCPMPQLALGVGRHKDSDAITVLSQDNVGGLEVRRKFDGEWIQVKPTADAFIINLGDVFQVWSNDKYESVEHRVTVNSESERFSIGFFFIPSHDVIMQPLEELTDKQNPAKYKAFNWEKFLSSKFFSNFKKLDTENLQISHFRTSE